MAEGWTRVLVGDTIEPYSAGIEKHRLNSFAVQVMAECSVNITSHYSKTTSDLEGLEFDYVVTVCGHAHETCPVFAGDAKVVHKGFDDPPKLTEGATTDAERLEPYRRVRDEIREFIIQLPDILEEL